MSGKHLQRNQHSTDINFVRFKLNYKQVAVEVGLMKVVIADDSEMLRERIKELLKNVHNVEIVGEAANGVEAIKIIQEKSPDFVLLDIRMPELNGIEVLKKIKGKKPKPTVCVFTNYPFPQYKTKCVEEGADYFLDKNINIQAIRDLIEQLTPKGR